MTPISDSRAWILTYTGKRFHPFAPEIDSISIVDIAHALSQQCRFTGHTKIFYSVAEHSVRVSDAVAVDPYNGLWGLLHDASEAYIADLSKPIKEFFLQYKEIEETIQRAVATRFGLTWHPPHGMPPAVKAADNHMLKTEQRDLMAPAEDGVICPWCAEIEPYPAIIVPLTAEQAEAEFLNRYREFSKIFAL